jgi:CheY-like chemotaxis protein
MSMNILLIEDNDHRRVTVLKHLLRSGHQVTPCSSVDEAKEVVQFITHRDAAPNAVVMACHLIDEGGKCFRRALAESFAGIRWIPFPFDRDLAWLAGQLEGAGHDRGLELLLVETDDDLRMAMTERLLDNGDRVTACRSMAEAAAALADRSGRSRRYDAILSSGSCLSLYVVAAKRFPGMRWILTSPSTRQPQSNDAFVLSERTGVRPVLH